MATDRTQSIGASDAPAVVCGPQFPIWAEKTGIAEPPDLDAVEAVQWGKILEATIAATYADRSGRTVEHNANADVTRHPDWLWMTATLDALQTDPKRGIGALEVKNVGLYRAKDWEGDTPLKVQIQLQHQLAVTGMPWGTLCALIGGNRMIWYDMDRNQRFIDAMIEKERDFWALVKSNTPPPPDGSIATAETLKRLYPLGTEGEIIALPVDATSWDAKLEAAKQRIKFWETDKRKLENQFRAAMGTATLGVLPGGGGYTLNTTNKKAFSVKATSFRTLRRQA